MKFKDYTWDKEFEIKGYFSEIPEDIVNEHDSLSGILHYSPSEIVLELFGAFEVESGISFGFGKYLEKIYGYSSDGKIIILRTPLKTYKKRYNRLNTTLQLFTPLRA